MTDQKANDNVVGPFATFCFVGFDLETTGLDVFRDEPIDMGSEVSVRRQAPAPNTAFEQLIVHSDQKKLTYPISHITGITSDMLADSKNKATTLKQAWTNWKTWLLRVRGVAQRPVLLCGHNLIEYDLALLCACLQRFKIDEHPELTLHKLGVVRLFDTLVWSRERCPTLANHRLATVHQHVTKRTFDGAHRARADARAALDIVLALPPDEVNVFAVPLVPSNMTKDQTFCEACGTVYKHDYYAHHCKWPITQSNTSVKG